MEYKVTHIYNINGQVVIADDIELAIKVYQCYANEPIKFITEVSAKSISEDSKEAITYQGSDRFCIDLEPDPYEPDERKLIDLD